MQRPTQLVDIGDVRAALKGLSLSPCKRRRLQSLTQYEEVGSFDKYEPVHALLGEDVKRKTRNSVETQVMLYLCVGVKDCEVTSFLRNMLHDLECSAKS